MSRESDRRSAFSLHESAVLDERYYEAVHPSGLRILVCPKKMTTAYAAIGVGYGSIHREADEPSGLAHFLEHKMFERRDGGDWDSRFNEIGSDVNAYTTYDRTAYECSCTDRFREALSALLELAGGLHVTKASVEREKGIIAEEIRMGLDDPWERLNAGMIRSLYAVHPIREEICGTEEDVASVTPRLLRRVFGKRYGFDRMVLCVSGDVTPEAVWDTVDGYLSSAGLTARHRPKGGSLPVGDLEEPSGVYRARTEITMSGTEEDDQTPEPPAPKPPAPKPLFSIGVKDPCVPTDPHEVMRRDLCMSVLTDMLFSCSEDFYNDLFESGLVTAETSCGSWMGGGFSFCTFSGESDDPDAVYAAFLSMTDRLHREGLSREAFDRCRRTQYADYVTGFDSTESIGTGLLNNALEGLGLYDVLTASADVTYERVSALFEEIFRPSQYAFVVVHPAGI
ncbi:MAG: insulinase family protein [Clostridia bacterium]|nr:insulinase family protein [Clostridia bacterium]